MFLEPGNDGMIWQLTSEGLFNYGWNVSNAMWGGYGRKVSPI